MSDMKKYLLVILIILSCILLYQLLQPKVDSVLLNLKSYLIPEQRISSQPVPQLQQHKCMDDVAPSSAQEQIVLEDTEVNYGNLDNEFMLSCDSDLIMTEGANNAILEALQETD